MANHKTPNLARVRAVLKYDPETGIFTWIERLAYRAPAGSRAGTVGKTGYRYIAVDGTRNLAHRLAWFTTHGRWPAQWIDHINGDPDDNRIANLREATPSQNLANISVHRDSLSGLKGVSRSGNKWEARIRCGDKIHRLGSFSNPHDAHSAYLAAAQKLFGEFARVA